MMNTPMKRTTLALAVTMLAACNSDTNVESSPTAANMPPAAGPTQPAQPAPATCATTDLSDANAVLASLKKPADFAPALSTLIGEIVDPARQKAPALEAAITGVKNATTDNLCELELYVFSLIDTDETGSLAPLTQVLNSVLVGLETNQKPADIAKALQALLDLEKAAAPTTGSGLISVVLGTTTGLLANGAITTPLNDLLKGLLDPSKGLLAPLTGLLDQLTTPQTGPLGGLTELVNALVGTPGQLLEPVVTPVVTLLNGILGGMQAGQTNEEIAKGLEDLLKLAKGDLFNRNTLARLPLVGGTLAATAPLVIQVPVATTPPATTTPTTPTTPAAPRPTVLASIPLVGGLLDGLLGGLLRPLGL